MQSIITHVDSSDEFWYISAINSTYQDIITPEELSSCLYIRLKTAARTLKGTTHQYIHTTGLLANRCRTEKAHIFYKQLSHQYNTFYTDFLNVQVTYIFGYCGGVSYTNKIWFKKFIPYDSEKGEKTGRSLCSLIELVGLPYSLQYDNHKNFKNGLFKPL